MGSKAWSGAQSLALALTCAAACSAGEDSYPFPAHPAGPGGGKNDAIEDSGSSQSDGTGSSGTSHDAPHAEDDGDDSTTAIDHSTDGGDADESTSGEDDGDPAETGVDPPDDAGPGQPATGLWAECTQDAYDNCTFAAPVCISGEFANGNEDGFCSKDMCDDPFVDCQPVPQDSDATPLCVEARDPMNAPVFLCALGCAQGEACPAGMQCVEGVSFGDDLPLYSFCV